MPDNYALSTSNHITILHGGFPCLRGEVPSYVGVQGRGPQNGQQDGLEDNKSNTHVLPKRGSFSPNSLTESLTSAPLLKTSQTRACSIAAIRPSTGISSSKLSISKTQAAPPYLLMLFKSIYATQCHGNDDSLPKDGRW